MGKWAPRRTELQRAWKIRQVITIHRILIFEHFSTTESDRREADGFFRDSTRRSARDGAGHYAGKKIANPADRGIRVGGAGAGLGTARFSYRAGAPRIGRRKMEMGCGWNGIRRIELWSAGSALEVAAASVWKSKIDACDSRGVCGPVREFDFSTACGRVE